MKKALGVVLLLLLSACSDAEKSQWSSLNQPHTVQVFGFNGQVVREYKSTGKVKTESQSDGWYFRDAATNELVRISGGFLIEIQPIQP